MQGFHYAEPSPDPFDGRKPFPWFRIVHKHPAGQETVVQDFIARLDFAHRMAARRDIEKHVSVANT
jgi:hypothetical protein